MTAICESYNFDVVSANQPHLDRLDGGHIKIVPKVRVVDRTELSPELAEELMLLTMVVGEAMAVGLNRRGIDVGRINYQDNGNWGVFSPDGPYLHVHVYGRAKSAKNQKYGDALYLPHRETGFFEGVEPLDADDIREIRAEMMRLLRTDKYGSLQRLNHSLLGQTHGP